MYIADRGLSESCPGTQKLLRLLWNMNVYYSVHQSLQVLAY
jgi:hypothetical protein